MSAERWTTDKAWEWHDAQGWKMGANFLPSTASNQLELWQQEYWDDAAQESVIDKELQWASAMGYNAMRVFLHNLVYQEEGEDQYLNRIDRFLDISSSHGIQVMFVLFDGCWDPNPKYGRQEDPRPFVHNSRWVQSPGRALLETPANYSTLLKPYVQSVLRRFGNDTRRVLLWDLFNEPDNPNRRSYGLSNLTRVPAAADANATDLTPTDKLAYSTALLNVTFQWARDVGPLQTPLTVALWSGMNDSLKQLVLDHVDVLSFHNYQSLTETSNLTQDLLSSQHGRPLICSEYMARPENSTFDPILGYLKSQGVSAFNWGLVSGRSQTIYPWNSWTQQYNESSLDEWFHDVLHPDGSPYSEVEMDYIRNVAQSEQDASGDAIMSFPTNIWRIVILATVVVCCLGLVSWRFAKMIRRRRNASADHNYRSAEVVGSNAAAEVEMTENDLELL